MLRPDLTVDDVTLVLMANAGVVRQLPGRAVEASERLVALLLDGLCAPTASPGAPPPEPEGPRRSPAASS